MEENALQVTIKGKSMLKEDRIDLYIFDPEPCRYKRVEYDFLTVALIFFVFVIISSSVVIDPYSYGVSAYFIFGIVMLLLSLFFMALFLIQFVIKSRDRVIFYNRFNGEPVLCIWNNNPNPKDFLEFTTGNVLKSMAFIQ